MIIDLNAFIKQGQVLWTELESILDQLDMDPNMKLGIDRVKRFHYLYQKASADLAKLMEFSAQQDVRIYLESIVGRAFAQIHENSRQSRKFNLFTWFFIRFPITFRKHLLLFWLALAILISGCVFGAATIRFDADSKSILMPFPHLMQDPAKRVAKAEKTVKDEMAGKKSTFASYLISNNTRVAFFALSLGTTWGVGTLLILFSNGASLGATIADYVIADQTQFMMGWLLPHGTIELPAILLAGQAGFILASAMIGWGKPISFKTRLRNISGDILTLMSGVCLMLVWAGFVEAFLSQYHQPFISYTLKIIFGCIQFLVLFSFLFLSGKKHETAS